MHSDRQLCKQVQMLPALSKAQYKRAKVLQTLSDRLTNDRSPRGRQHDRRLLQTLYAAALLRIVLTYRGRIFVVSLNVFPMMARPKTATITVQPSSVDGFHEMHPGACHLR